jgi:hypothetical protein
MWRYCALIRGFASNERVHFQLLAFVCIGKAVNEWLNYAVEANVSVCSVRSCEFALFGSWQAQCSKIRAVARRASLHQIYSTEQHRGNAFTPKYNCHFSPLGKALHLFTADTGSFVRKYAHCFEVRRSVQTETFPLYFLKYLQKQSWIPYLLYKIYFIQILCRACHLTITTFSFPWRSFENGIVGYIYCPDYVIIRSKNQKSLNLSYHSLSFFSSGFHSVSARAWRTF